MRQIGRNRNRVDTAISHNPVTLNNLTAVTIAPANPDRIFLEISMFPGLQDVNIFIRLYPASVDNLLKGCRIGRYNLANDVFFLASWRMPPDNIYTGEISAIVDVGTEDVLVTEY